MVIDPNRLAVRRRLRDAHIAWDHRLEHLRAKMPAHVRRDEVAKIVALVVHRQHHPVQFEPRVQRPLHALDCAHQLGQALQRVELALQRHQYRIGRDEGVDCQQVQRRRTIDQRLVIVAQPAAYRAAQQEFAPLAMGELELGPGEVL